MKLKLNVQITLYGMEKSCAVWSDERNDIPGIGEYTGVGRNIDEAVDDFFREVPMVMETSDGQKADMSRMEYELRRPYSVVLQTMWYTFKTDENGNTGKCNNTQVPDRPELSAHSCRREL